MWVRLCLKLVVLWQQVRLSWAIGVWWAWFSVYDIKNIGEWMLWVLYYVDWTHFFFLCADVQLHYKIGWGIVMTMIFMTETMMLRLWQITWVRLLDTKFMEMRIMKRFVVVGCLLSSVHVSICVCVCAHVCSWIICLPLFSVPFWPFGLDTGT